METQNSLSEGCHSFHVSLMHEQNNEVTVLTGARGIGRRGAKGRWQYLHGTLSLLIAEFVSQLLIKFMLKVPTQLKMLLEKFSSKKLLLNFLICCAAAEESSVLPDFSFSVSQ